MIDIVLKKDKTIRRTKHEDIYEGENKISWINVYLPETINDVDIKDYNIVLRCYINADNYIPYTLDTTKSINKIDITHEFTDKDRYIDAYLYITRADEVIGKTNTVSFRVNNAKDGSGLTPREQFDERIAELENENEGLECEVAEQATEIEAKDGQISELNDEITEKDGQITELNTENARLENLTDTQRETIQNMLDNPPQPKLYTPPVVTPSGSVQQINPPTGYDGLNNAVVDRVSAEGVNFHSEWYKEGKECLGKVGTYNPFPEHSYGGIYYTELGEGGYPKKILIKDMLRSASTIPQFFNTSNDAKRELREVIFENCPGFLTTAESLFRELNYLTKVLLPDSLTIIGASAFNGCTSLTELTLPDSLTIIGKSAFNGCTSLTELTLPDSLMSIGQYAFQNCTSLTEISLPDSLTSIGNSAFYGCTSLTEISLPDSLTSIGASAFYNCSSLIELTLPDSLTSIGANACYWCTSLTELTLPNSLTSIGSYAFQICTSLTNLTLAQGFNCNGLNVSDSTRFTAETIVACLEALADRTGLTAYTITFGSTNLNKLTAEQRAIATNKNWNLA